MLKEWLFVAKVKGPNISCVISLKHPSFNKQLKHSELHCSVIEHGMMSFSFQTAAQKNEAKLSFFCAV